MPNYIFTPSPLSDESQPFYTFWEDGFTSDELKNIDSLCRKAVLKQATVGDTNELKNLRRSEVGWVDCNEETEWLYARVAHITRSLNSKYYNFDLYGIVEPFQYTVYDGKNLGHYEWHVDTTVSSSPRKMSFVLQLSDPSEYEGGELQLMFSNEATVMKKQRGHSVVFPSYMLHRVTPVTSGIRRTLVMWVSGPAFK